MAKKRKRKAAKRKTSKRRRAGKSKATKCAVKSINGRRRRICRDAKGRIKSNTKA